MPDDIEYAAKEITSVADALTIAATDSHQKNWDWSDPDVRPKYKPPFGIWYRGQGCPNIPVPSVYRYHERNGVRERINESSLYLHFRLRSPDYRKNHFTPFEWLCLMQHYGAPTRLLDWSESVLVALYFAVENKEDHGKDGDLYVLNAASLNYHSDVPIEPRRAMVHMPERYNVVVRALMACHSSIGHVLRSPELRGVHATDSPTRQLSDKLARLGSNDDLDDEVRAYFKQLSRPIAVFPYRTHPRLLLQQGMFTIHGGHTNEKRTASADLALAPEQFNDFAETPFLRRYRVVSEHKQEIRDQLISAGIHKSSLFPELDQQSEYMRELWSHPAIEVPAIYGDTGGP